MKHIFFLLLSSFLIQSDFVMAEEKLSLEGKAFEVQVTKPGEEPITDRIFFLDGKFRSLVLKEKGFPDLKCKIKNKKNEIVFTAKGRSVGDVFARWEGMHRENYITGTKVIKEDGKKTESSFYSGPLLPPLYERLKKAFTIAKISQEWVRRVQKKGILKLPDLDAGVEYHVTEWLSSLSGGPQKYTGIPVDEVLINLKLNKETWNRLNNELIDVLQEMKVERWDREELIALLDFTKPTEE